MINILEELLHSAPIAYDMGIDIKTIRTRKKRKASNGMHKRIQTIVMTSQGVAEVGSLAVQTILQKAFTP